jgi:uncharacterized membrane protein
METALILGSWALGTALLTAGCYNLALWGIPYIVTDRTLKRMKRMGRKTNVLGHRELNNADNCRIPQAIADSMMSGCIYDVTKRPLRITSWMPEDSYWSISFYARNTDNFFIINDLEVRERFGDRVAIVLLGPKQTYQPRLGEIVLQAASRIGYIIVRMMVTDTKDPDALKQVATVQRKAFAEEIYPLTGNGTAGHFKYRGVIKMPENAVFEKIMPSRMMLIDWIKTEYSVSVDPNTVDDPKAVIPLPGGLTLTFRPEKAGPE